MKSKWQLPLAAQSVSACLAALLLLPQVATDAARDGLRLCAQVLIPSLFPFFVCAKLIVALRVAQPLARVLSPVMRSLFGTGPSSSEALVLGLIGGYPAGAQAVKNLYDAKAITQREAQRLVLFCNNAGPAFVFGVVGTGLFASFRMGLLLFAAQALSALLTGMLLKSDLHEPAPASIQTESSAPVRVAPVFVSCVRESGAAVLNVCMFVTAFSVLAGVLRWLLRGQLPDTVFALVLGMLELTGGISALGACAIPVWGKLALASFLLAFSGLSVCAQTASILLPSGLFPRAYVPVRLMQGLLAAALTLALYAVFGNAAAAIPAAAFFPQAAAKTAGAIGLAVSGIICLIFRKVSYGNRR